MNALHVAEKLIALGLAPMPLASPDDSREQAKPIDKRGKAPFERGWQRKPCPQSLADLLALRPEHNVGVRTGRVAGARYQVVVVDIDSQNAFYWAQQALPPTNIVTLTGRVEAGWRGQHWYYRRPETAAEIRFPNKAGVKWRDEFHDGHVVTLRIDVKADEGQVVAPGSRHGTGGVYEEAAPWTLELLASMPAIDMSIFECLTGDPGRNQDADTSCAADNRGASPVSGDERGEDVSASGQASAADADADEDPTRGRSLAERRRRFAAYLRTCEPSYPGIGGGAGAHCLQIARAGCWGLSLPPAAAAREMLGSEWNGRCHDGRGAAYPWGEDELLHKCRDASKPGSSDGRMRRPRGWMLDETNTRHGEQGRGTRDSAENNSSDVASDRCDHERGDDRRADASGNSDDAGPATAHERTAEDESGNRHNRTRRVIDITPNVSRVTDAVLEALAATDDGQGSPLVYARDGHLVSVFGGNAIWLDAHALSIVMDRATDFFEHARVGRGEPRRMHVKPPMDIAQKILSMGAWPGIPELRRIVRLPPVSPGGVVGTRPGYDSASRTYYAGQLVVLPDAPTRREAFAARDRLLRFVRAIRFRGEVDRAKWLAYLLTVATRTAYGLCPLFLVTANSQGSGKTITATLPFRLLCDEEIAPSVTFTERDPDKGKKLYSLSLKRLILWDNEQDGSCISNATVASIATSGLMDDRELGKQRDLRADFRGSVIVYTGNKVTLDSDLSERATVIHLAGKPDADSTFDPRLETHLAGVRPQCLRDAYTIVKAWSVAGCPPIIAAPHERFGEWSRVVQQICLWLELPDPVTDNSDMNFDVDALCLVIGELRRMFEDRAFRTREVLNRAERDDERAKEVCAAAATLTKRQTARSGIMLGQQLSALCDKLTPVGTLVSLGRAEGRQRFRINYADDCAGPAQEPAESVPSTPGPGE